jgi:hypothetical protein
MQVLTFFFSQTSKEKETVPAKIVVASGGHGCSLIQTLNLSKKVERKKERKKKKNLTQCFVLPSSCLSSDG